MRGHIRKRARGSWTVVITLPRDPGTRRPRQKWITVRGTRRDAERVLAETIAQVQAGTYGTAPARLTVSEYLERWLNAARPRLRPQTFLVWSRSVRYWVELLGGRYLARLNPMDVQEAVDALPAHLSQATRAQLFGVLRAALKQAVRWGLIARCPTDGVRAPRRGAPSLRVWNEEQVRAFLQAVRGSRYYAVYHVALATGMRLGELLGLTWEDMDLSSGSVEVRRSLILPCRGEPVWQEPKTPRSRRRVPLDPVTVEVLKRHREQQEKERLVAGPGWHGGDLVFTTRKGTPLAREELAKTLKRVALRLGLPVIRFHDLRHTHASILLRKGVHPKVVSERLGHSSVALTLDVYSHVLPDIQREAARAMAQVWRDSLTT